MDKTGDPDSTPGEGAEREIQPNFLVPFNFGRQREVVFRQARGAIILLGISSSSWQWFGDEEFQLCKKNWIWITLLMRLFDKLKSRMHLVKVRLWTTTTIHSGWTQDHQSIAIYFGCTDYQTGSSPGWTWKSTIIVPKNRDNVHRWVISKQRLTAPSGLGPRRKPGRGFTKGSG